MLNILLIVLLAMLALVATGMLFLQYMRRVNIERDLHFAGEDIHSVPLSMRIMAKVVPVLRTAHSKVVAWWYGHPSEKLKLVGVTGTNGKTTTATVLYELFRKMGHRCGLISTVCICINDEKQPAVITTPGAVQLNRLIDRMAKEGCEYVFMECSSHGLVHKRVSALHFAGGIFTNLTRDHLDYHHTFDNYRNAKKSFFDLLPAEAFAIVNADDASSGVMTQDCKATVKTYSICRNADFMAEVIRCDADGMLLRIDGQVAQVRLVGKYNASNLLAVYAAAVMLGKTPGDVLDALPKIESVRGRLTPIRSPKGYTAFVDYAHTPDALENVLATLREVTGGGRIITVCGAGGNRDKGKRPLMAQVAARMSDYVILTSDNPRFERPMDIIHDMMAGVDATRLGCVACVEDRREAIGRACEMAGKGDVVLIAGKGHETDQEINGVKHHFSDIEALQELAGD